MAYTGSVELISGIKQKNDQDFPLVDASAVRVDDNTRLSDILTEMTGKIDATAIVSTEYVSGGVYNVGDVVTKDNKIYKCIQAVGPFDVWNPSQWEEYPVQTQISEVKSTLSGLSVDVAAVVQDVENVQKDSEDILDLLETVRDALINEDPEEAINLIDTFLLDHGRLAPYDGGEG